MGSEEIHALKDVTFQVPAGKFAWIRGTSGSGKTSLLNLIAGLDEPTSGDITFAGQSVVNMSEAEKIQYRRKQISFVFQTFGLLPYLTVEENVEIPLRLLNTPRKERQERVLEVLSLVALDHRLKHRTYELSGGEQQRVAIARGLVNRPSMLLADEPTGQLDSNTGEAIIRLLHEICQQFSVTVIVASHDSIVAEYANIIVELKDGEVVEIEDQETSPKFISAVG